MRYSALFIVALLFAGCSLFGGDGKAQVEFRLSNSSQDTTSLPIQVRFSTADQSKTLLRSDFSGPEGSTVAGPFDTATSGQLTVDAALLNQEGDPLTSGTVKLPLKSDWEYRVTVAVGQTNPIRGCFGCQGSKAFAVDPALEFAPQDSLFIVWGGNSISNPIVY
jgi:hypothetical protein